MNENIATSFSIVIPCRNESRFIVDCLDSIVANDFPSEELEVLVVDGMSDDGSRELVELYSQTHPFVKLVNNPKRDTASALNSGIKKSRGKFITILSSHAKIARNFIIENIDNLIKHEVDCSGGVMVTVPADNSPFARAISVALSHPFGVGNASFRIGANKPTHVDTVPFGCYKKEVFDKIGYFDERLVRNQDIEFNLRLKRAAGKLLLVPTIRTYYYARSNLKDLFKQSFDNGFWVIYGLKFARLPFSARHLVPFAFVLSVLMSAVAALFSFPFFLLLGFIAGIYFMANLFFSIILCLGKGFTNLPFLATTFFTLHVSYGLGSIWGLVKMMNVSRKQDSTIRVNEV